MFAKQLNQIAIDVAIEPRGPLAIRSGRQGPDPSRPDLECVRTGWGGGPSVYVPGSSLKGVMRSHAERLLRSEDLAITPTFTKTGAFNQKSPGDAVYRGTCPLGRTFGTLHLKGHLAVSDHLPGAHEPEGSDERRRQIELANAVEQRNGVAIDRLLGSVAGGALYDQEVVVAGRFDGRIVLRNAQLYQLTLALMVLRDLDEGYTQLGSATSRGFGRVKAEIRQVVVESRRGRAPAGCLAGAGTVAGADDVETYGLYADDQIDLPAGLAPRPRLMWDRLTVPADRIDELAESLVAGPWLKFLGQAEGKRWEA